MGFRQRRHEGVRLRTRLELASGLRARREQGSVTYTRCPPKPVSRDDLRELDLRAFDGFEGMHRTGDHYVVATTARALVGYALFLPPVGEGWPWQLDAVAVLPQRRSEGIGTQLVREGAEWLLDSGAEALTAVALFGDDKDRRERWFARMGGVPDRLGAFSFSTRDLVSFTEPDR